MVPWRSWRSGSVAAVAAITLGVFGSRTISVDADVLGGLEGHPAVDQPADLTRDEAADYYDSLAERMAGRYAISRQPAAVHYQKWKRFNSVPYKSQTHGNRYVNNYANAVAERAGYGDMQEGDVMPEGAVIAKDSFTVTAERARYIGALFIMEKQAPGSSPDFDDWRYIMILPDGSFLGDSADAEMTDQVRFCHECHEERAAYDYLFFLPDDYRLGAAPE